MEVDQEVEKYEVKNQEKEIRHIHIVTEEEEESV